MKKFEQINITLTLSIAVPSDNLTDDTADHHAQACAVIAGAALREHYGNDHIGIIGVEGTGDFENYGKPQVAWTCRKCQVGE